MRSRLTVLLLVLASVAALGAGPDAPPGRPIVVLVSIDGARWDDAERFQLPALTRLALRGVRAEGLIPQFPSKTFPNHYSMVTGLRPGRHGIVSNNMRAPDIPGRFALGNREVVTDARWWGGEPIWNTAERQGLVAATLFWPGSEAAIGGQRPTYWRAFDDGLPNPARVAQVLEWLRLPDTSRPSFLTVYFSDVDRAGHRFGPDAAEVREAARGVDGMVGRLVAGVDAAGLAGRAHVIVVSDHGMVALSDDRLIVLDDYVDPATVDVVDWSPVIALSPRDGDVDRLYAALKGRHPALAVYRNGEIPAAYHLAGHARVPAVVGIADEGWHITSRREMAVWARGERRRPGGMHGYDGRLRSMHGLFVAAGPRFRQGAVVAPFENIDVYNLICATLGIDPAPNDGDSTVARSMLR